MRKWKCRVRGRRANVKCFTKILSVKYFTQICLDWFGWLKIFYWKTNMVKWENIFLKICYIEQTEHKFTIFYKFKLLRQLIISWYQSRRFWVRSLTLLYLLFKMLNSHLFGSHLLRESLGPQVRGSIKLMIKLLNLSFPTSLNFWDNR